MASDTYHEPLALLSETTKDLHRAISSLMEELEAVDWYQQRAEATQDPDLRAVLEHNRDEETEHAMMVLEWMRRNNAVFDKNIRTYLLKTGPITMLEAAAEEKGGAPAGESARETPPNRNRVEPERRDGSLGVGSLKGT